MESRRLWAVRGGGALVALLLQIAVAPFISLGLTTPNFLVAWCVATAMADPSDPPYLTAFLLGIAFDITGGGPVGAMAFCLLVVTFAVTRVYMVVSNDTVFMTVAFAALAVFATELLYGLIVAAVVPDISVGGALLYRSLPNSLYNFVVALLLYPVAAFLHHRLVAQSAGMPVL